MKVLLAGHNVDRELLVEWHRFLELMLDYLNPDRSPDIPRPTELELRAKIREWLQADNMTPETLSAAYARISRDPRPVDQLRAESRQWVSKARRSNRSIVFGLGHNSVAEHATFNLDVIGLSRLAMESLQMHRLCSYTEKSQRYIRLGQDFIVPDEIHTMGLSAAFQEYVERQFARYERISAILADALGKDPSDTGEDARYVLPLCVTSQMGLTLNARNLEYLLRCTASSPLSEIREFGRAAFRVVDGVAPSLIKYTDSTAALSELAATLRARVATLRSRVATLRSRSSDFSPSPSADPPGNPVRDVTLLWGTPDADRKVLDALFMRAGIPHDASLAPDDCRGFFTALYGNIEAWDPMPREFEYAEACFEIRISAAAFGQLKRHRMATLTTAPYDPSDGVTMPPLFHGTDAVEVFSDGVRDAEAMFEMIHARNPDAAPYPLLNAHRRCLRVQMNARELNHLARLRQDQHAQWDIRGITGRMIEAARDIMPLSLLFACGKDAFDETRKRLLEPGDSA